MGKKVFLLAVAAALFLHHAYFFYGYFGFDDLHYAELAHRLLRGEVDFANQYTYRILPLAVTAGSYHMFGVSDWSSALPALLASVVVLYLFYRVFRTGPFYLLLLAVVGYLGMPWNLFYSDKLMPDIYVSAGCFGGWVAYHQCRVGSGRGARVLGLLAACSLFLAFNSKGTVILLVPLFASYFLGDLLQRRRWRFWLTLSAATLVLLGVYFYGLHALTGSALARFEAIAGTHYLNPCSYDILPRQQLIERLTTGFYTLIRDAGILPHAGIAMLGGGYLLTIGRSVAAHALFYPATALLSLLSINFMTISLTSYNPVCLDPRHILLFSPILSVCSTLTIAAILRHSGWRSDGWPFRLFLLGLCVLLLLPAVRQVKYGTSLEYSKVRRAYTELIDSSPRPVVFYGSEVSRNLGNFYTGYTGETEGIHFRNFTQLSDCSVTQADTTRYLLQSWYADWHAGLSRQAITTEVRSHAVERDPSDLTVPGLELERIRCR
ncbi:hypothetical protein LEM8419_02935 [Neolewinella maritima]|uniref:Glycosyltransferase RgtA/B/C/D-like domain-containing protein n=1 Tax=Neolewinella maritima TaxID=1383882 RepID=A0ABN8FCF1_9BACT|nr:hypothetical protein [Neolewinella maritima]CAH1002020.1 hypothetical protein LEM8419_02935 [Neolewinella maritima]